MSATAAEHAKLNATMKAVDPYTPGQPSSRKYALGRGGGKAPVVYAAETIDDESKPLLDHVDTLRHEAPVEATKGVSLERVLLGVGIFISVMFIIL